MAKKYIDVMDTTFRDGLDSMIDTHVSMEHFLPAVSVASECGVTHFEFVEKNRFNSIDLLKVEDPFEMMVRFRESAGVEANLQANIYGLNNFMKSSASLEFCNLFSELFSKYETTTVRNYDPLNDIRNLESIGNSIVNSGMMNEIAITLMEPSFSMPDIYDLEFYQNKIFDILDSAIPFDSIAFIDENGTTTPSKIYEIVKFAREILGDSMHIRVHTHDTLGMGIAFYLAALDAGADGIDLSSSPLSGGVGQPDILAMLHATKGTNYNLGDLEIKKIEKYQEFLKYSLRKYSITANAKEIHSDTIFNPIPKDEILVNIEKMKRDGNFHIFNKVLSKTTKVIEQAGYAAPIYPISQYYWEQAHANTIYGEFTKIIPEYGKILLGYYGQTPIVPDPNIIEIAQNKLNLKATTKSPIDIANGDKTKSIKYWKEKLKTKDIDATEENIFLALCVK